MFEKLVDYLIDELGYSNKDAITTAIFALGGFWIDIGLLPGGIPTGTMTLLFGGAGFLSSKVVSSIPAYQNFILNRIDKLVKRGHISEKKGKKIKKELINQWRGEKNRKKGM